MILVSFLVAILIGTLLLFLPISSADGESIGFVNALLTATSATCVTGLVAVPTFSSFSIFGQAVILFLIQIGGLGIITVMAAIAFFMKKEMGLSDRVLLQDSFNLNTLFGLSEFIKKVVVCTLAVEGIGALLYMTVFVPDFGARGIWVSVFTSVSAFCNAGIDIIAADSLCSYYANPLVNIVTCSLIILGGIGYIVWWDVVRVLKEAKRKRRLFASLTLHSKIALVSTLFWILFGAVTIFIFEYDNPLTMGGFSTPQKIMASVFQSVTTRTAGFATVSQSGLTNASAFVSLLLMFIGGSPVGTAGGIKTVTFTVLMAAAISAIKNKDSVTIFGRSLSRTAVRKATSVCAMSFLTVFVSSVLLSACTDASALDIMYETVSATATVGLTRDLTPLLSTVGKLIVTATMYFGRVGPISLAIAFNIKKEDRNSVKDPVEEISVG